MSQSAIALHDANLWGFKRPRKWLCKYGAIYPGEEDYAEYVKVRKQISQLVTKYIENNTNYRMCINENQI